MTIQILCSEKNKAYKCTIQGAYDLNGNPCKMHPQIKEILKKTFGNIQNNDSDDNHSSSEEKNNDSSDDEDNRNLNSKDDNTTNSEEKKTNNSEEVDNSGEEKVFQLLREKIAIPNITEKELSNLCSNLIDFSDKFYFEYHFFLQGNQEKFFEDSYKDIQDKLRDFQQKNNKKKLQSLKKTMKILTKMRNMIQEKKAKNEISTEVIQVETDNGTVFSKKGLNPKYLEQFRQCLQNIDKKTMIDDFFNNLSKAKDDMQPQKAQALEKNKKLIMQMFLSTDGIGYIKWQLFKIGQKLKSNNINPIFMEKFIQAKHILIRQYGAEENKSSDDQKDMNTVLTKKARYKKNKKNKKNAKADRIKSIKEIFEEHFNHFPQISPEAKQLIWSIKDFCEDDLDINLYHKNLANMDCLDINKKMFLLSIIKIKIDEIIMHGLLDCINKGYREQQKILPIFHNTIANMVKEMHSFCFSLYLSLEKEREKEIDQVLLLSLPYNLYEKEYNGLEVYSSYAKESAVFSTKKARIQQQQQQQQIQTQTQIQQKNY